MKNFDITPIVMRFSHEISADKIIFIRTKEPNRTLLGQLQDAIQEEINKL